MKRMLERLIENEAYKMKNFCSFFFSCFTVEIIHFLVWLFFSLSISKMEEERKNELDKTFFFRLVWFHLFLFRPIFVITLFFCRCRFGEDQSFTLTCASAIFSFLLFLSIIFFLFTVPEEKKELFNSTEEVNYLQWYCDSLACYLLRFVFRSCLMFNRECIAKP